MKKKLRITKIIYIIFIITLTIGLCNPVSYGIGDAEQERERDQAWEEHIIEYKGGINPDAYKPGDLTDADVEPIVSRVSGIVSALQVIGIVILVVAMTLMGVKYMLGSLEERAEYKKAMIPYIVGVFLIVAITQLLGIISNLVSSFNK